MFDFIRRRLYPEWSIIDAAEVPGTVTLHPRAFILFTINDCPICAFAKSRLSLRQIRRLKVEPFLVVFRELNPGDMRLMEELHVYNTPQGRLYVDGQVVSAWESIEQGATAKDLNLFNVNWLKSFLPRR